MDRPRWNLWPPTIFTVIVLSFLAATGLGQWRLHVLDDAVVEIASTTAPSIEHLAVARGETRSLQRLLRERADGAGDGSPRPPTADLARRTLDQSINDYLALPVAPDEGVLWRRIVEAKTALDHASARVDAAVERGDREAASAILRADVPAIAIDLDAAITSAIEFNAARSRNLALEIQRLRTTALYVAGGLDIVCTLIAVGGAILLRRMVRAHDALMDRNRELQEERASELEQFAGRVAHDILSPLGTVGLALELAPRARDDEERARFVARGSAAVERIKRLVSGLLGFARAGAKPGPDAHADVALVMNDLAAELEPTASAAGATLTMRHDDGARVVACNPGVLTSLIANLVRNAIKYIGDGPTRRVEVRAEGRGESVRVEVEDTGPGLPPDVEDRVFDAYARSRNATQPGIGLGLATVKRLAEAHGGGVGVVSMSGKGCTFWFELPKAASVAKIAPIDRTPEACTT